MDVICLFDVTLWEKMQHICFWPGGLPTFRTSCPPDKYKFIHQAYIVVSLHVGANSRYLIHSPKTLLKYFMLQQWLYFQDFICGIMS